MYKRYYDGYGRIRKDVEHGEIIVPKETEIQNVCKEKNSVDEVVSSDSTAITAINNCSKNGVLSLPLELDDLILIGILLFLLWDSDNNDPVMLVIIAFLLLGDVI